MIYDDLSKSVGRCIKAARLAKGLTLEELGAKVGVTKATIQRYESGYIKKINPDKLQPLANALGISVYELLPVQHLSNASFAEKQTKIATLNSLVAELYGNEMLSLLKHAVALNSDGIKKLDERATELLEVKRYNVTWSEYESNNWKEKIAEDYEDMGD